VYLPSDPKKTCAEEMLRFLNGDSLPQLGTDRSLYGCWVDSAQKASHRELEAAKNAANAYSELLNENRPRKNAQKLNIANLSFRAHVRLVLTLRLNYFRGRHVLRPDSKTSSKLTAVQYRWLASAVFYENGTPRYEVVTKLPPELVTRGRDEAKRAMEDSGIARDLRSIQVTISDGGFGSFVSNVAQQLTNHLSSTAMQALGTAGPVFGTFYAIARAGDAVGSLFSASADAGANVRRASEVVDDLLKRLETSAPSKSTDQRPSELPLQAAVLALALAREIRYTDVSSKAWDALVKINKTDTRNMSLADVQDMLRGVCKDKVNVFIRRLGGDPRPTCVELEYVATPPTPALPAVEMCNNLLPVPQ
jgi:hypothetical protein